ncbi:DUF4123 domain-containing protein [Pseudomonas fluorescens]|uniref:DUF4123 domain-containing protein n=1 Tax=Pseudomonas fluorescens TaxID=294 RepID=A0A327MRQ5_PSEFL|nr:DUF4123 domain-containing protein [Pseudomonas fluorescens]RAI65511.1 DUF4123 domain-containing protein [Pseudomonas fluorescens]
MKTPIQWLEQIEQVCASAELHEVNLLLDQANWSHCAVPGLQALGPKAPWFSLFTGMPEEKLLDQAPLLMRLDLTIWQHRAWLEELIEHGASEARLMVLVTSLRFEELSHALQALLQMQWGERVGLLRFYDPRIFPELMNSILTSEQRAEFLQVACCWGWLDREDQPQWLPGTRLRKQSGIEVSPFVELSDEQCARIMCIGEAQQLLTGGEFDHLDGSREQRFNLLYSLILQARQESYVGDLSDYIWQNFPVSNVPV